MGRVVAWAWLLAASSWQTAHGMSTVVVISLSGKPIAALYAAIMAGPPVPYAVYSSALSLSSGLLHLAAGIYGCFHAVRAVVGPDKGNAWTWFACRVAFVGLIYAIAAMSLQPRSLWVDIRTLDPTALMDQVDLWLLVTAVVAVEAFASVMPRSHRGGVAAGVIWVLYWFTQAYLYLF